MKESKIVLYADDDLDDKLWVKDACDAVKTELEMEFVNNGKQVLNYLKTHQPPSLIVLDLNMPDLDGKQTLKAIKAQPSYLNIPIAIVTTSSSRLDMEVCNRLGADLFLTKPDSYSAWQDIIRKLEPLLQ